MASQTYIPTPGSLVVNGSNIPTFTIQNVRGGDGNAVGPYITGNGATPATIPTTGGAAHGMAGRAGLFAGLSGYKLGLVFAGMFLLGIYGLHRVHWR